MIDKVLSKIQKHEDKDDSWESLDLRNLLKPNKIVNNPGNVQINDKFYRSILVTGFPRSIDSRFIAEILNSDAPVDISLRINPFEQNQARRKVRKQLTKLEKDKRSKERQGEIAESIKNRVKDVKNLHRALDVGDERLFNLSLNMATSADTEEELEKNTEKVVSEMNKQQLLSGIPYYKMLQAFQTVLPLSSNRIRKHVESQPRSMPTGALAELFPFAGQPSQLDSEGILLGSNLNTRQPVLTDVFDATNPNWMTVGTSGSGKSFAAKLMLSRYVSQGVTGYVIDPHGEYSDVVKNLSGQDIELSIKKGNMINPLDLMGHSYREKLLSLEELFGIMFDGLTKSQKPKIMKAVRRTYTRQGIVEEDPETWESVDAPKLRDLLETLKDMRSEENDTVQLKSYDVLIEQLEPYVYGANNFLDTETSVEPDSHLTNFNIEDLPESHYPEMMFIVLDFLYSRMKSDRDRKMIVVDEAWELLRQAGQGSGKGLDSSFVLRVVKTSRKYNLSLGLIVQELEDLLGTRQGGSVLANTSSKLVLKQDRSVAEKISRKLELNSKEKSLIKNSGTGRGLFIVDDRHTPIQVQASKREENIVDSSPESFEVKQSYSIQSGPSSDGFPMDDLYFEEDLSTSQVEELSDRSSWRKDYTPAFRGGKGKTSWVRVSGEAGAEHQKLVYAYRDFLEEFSSDVGVTSRKADVEFVSSDGLLVGLEVETGQNLKHDKQSLERKMERNDELYDDWFFVVTRKDYRGGYSEFGRVLIRNEVEDCLKSYF